MAGQKSNLQVIAGKLKAEPPGPFSKESMIRSILKLYPGADLTLEWKEKYGRDGYGNDRTYCTVTLSDTSVYCHKGSYYSLEDAFREFFKELQQKNSGDLFERLARIERALK